MSEKPDDFEAELDEFKAGLTEFKAEREASKLFAEITARGTRPTREELETIFDLEERARGDMLGPLGESDRTVADTKMKDLVHEIAVRGWSPTEDERNTLTDLQKRANECQPGPLGEQDRKQAESEASELILEIRARGWSPTADERNTFNDLAMVALGYVSPDGLTGHVREWGGVPAGRAMAGEEGAPLGWPDDSVPYRTTTFHDGWTVEVWWRVINGRPEPVEVRVLSVSGDAYGRVVTAEVIRNLPLGEIFKDGRRTLRNLSVSTLRHPSVNASTLEEARPLVAAGKPQKGLTLTDGDLAKVAEVYRSAWIEGRPVIAAVSEALYLSKSGAQKRIGKARKAGLLDGVGPRR